MQQNKTVWHRRTLQKSSANVKMKYEGVGDQKRDILCPFGCTLFAAFHPVAIPDAILVNKK